MDKIFLFVGLGAAFAALIALAVFLIVRLRKSKQTENGGLYWAYQDKWLLNAFDNYDCAVYGFRGTGKDVLFAHAINLKGGKHYSNIFYNADTEVRDLKDLNVGGNTYEDFINGNIRKFESNFEDGYHFFISDAGVYLGCQYNKELNQNYGELPIHIALRRHLYDSHVHTNSQALNRPWDKVREQQGCFIHTLGTIDCGDFLIVKAISYTKYESALECLPPPDKPAAERGKAEANATKYKFHVMKYGETRAICKTELVNRAYMVAIGYEYLETTAVTYTDDKGKITGGKTTTVTKYSKADANMLQFLLINRYHDEFARDPQILEIRRELLKLKEQIANGGGPRADDDARRADRGHAAARIPFYGRSPT